MPENHIPCSKGLYDGEIVPKSHSKLMCAVSLLCIPSGVYAIYRGHHDLAAVPLGVCLTSLNYWRRPTYSWRRTLDMTYVACGVLYQCYRAVGAEHQWHYYAVLGTAISCFPLSWLVHRHNIWYSTVLHAGIHVFGNISNFVLYAGHMGDSPNPCVGPSP